MKRRSAHFIMDIVCRSRYSFVVRSDFSAKNRRHTQCREWIIKAAKHSSSNKKRKTESKKDEVERRGERVVGTSARARVCSPVVIFLLRFNNLAFFSIVVINNSRESERKNSDVEAKRENFGVREMFNNNGLRHDFNKFLIISFSSSISLPSPAASNTANSRIQLIILTDRESWRVCFKLSVCSGNKEVNSTSSARTNVNGKKERELWFDMRKLIARDLNWQIL